MSKKAKRALIITLICILVLFCILLGILLGVLGVEYRLFDILGDEVYDLSEAPEEDALRVMTFNIRSPGSSDRKETSWFHRAELVAGTIAQQAPDLIGFQEMTHEQEAYLKKHLVGYTFYACYRDDFRKSEAPAIAYRSDRFEVLEQGCFWLSETPDVSSKGWGAAFPRNANYAILRDKRTGKTFSYCNTHLDHASAEAREYGARVLMARLQQWDMPGILTGDLNDGERASGYQTILDAGYQDLKYAAAESDPGQAGISFNNYGKTKGRLLDFGFVKGVSQALSYRILDEKPGGEFSSDHYPILFRILI